MIFAGVVVVDCSASDDTALLLSRAAGWGLCIVLANKKPLTSSMVSFHIVFGYKLEYTRSHHPFSVIQDIYSKLCKRRRRIRYESTVRLSNGDDLETDED